MRSLQALDQAAVDTAFMNTFDAAALPNDHDFVYTCMSKQCGWPVVLLTASGFSHGVHGRCMNPEQSHEQVLCMYCSRFVNHRNFRRLNHTDPHEVHSQGRCVVLTAPRLAVDPVSLSCICVLVAATPVPVDPPCSPPTVTLQPDNGRSPSKRIQWLGAPRCDRM